MSVVETNDFNSLYVWFAVTGDGFAQILDEVLLPSIRILFGDGPIYLVQDNSPIHKSMPVRHWLEEHPQVHILFWPARSPDMNPIENVWGWITNEWDHRNERTPAALEQHALAVWESLRRSSSLIENLCDSMPKRIQALRDAGGLYTKY